MKEKQNLNFKIGETVVYPKHGVGEIVNIEPMEISSIKINFYVVKMEQAKLTILVPLDKQDEVGLRKISTKKIIDEIYEILKLKPRSTTLFMDTSFAGVSGDFKSLLFSSSKNLIKIIPNETNKIISK